MRSLVVVVLATVLIAVAAGCGGASHAGASNAGASHAGASHADSVTCAFDHASESGDELAFAEGMLGLAKNGSGLSLAVGGTEEVIKDYRKLLDEGCVTKTTVVRKLTDLSDRATGYCDQCSTDLENEIAAISAE